MRLQSQKIFFLTPKGEDLTEGKARDGLSGGTAELNLLISVAMARVYRDDGLLKELTEK